MDNDIIIAWSQSPFFMLPVEGAPLGILSDISMSNIAYIEAFPSPFIGVPLNA